MADKPNHITIPRRVFHIWAITTVMHFVLILASFQYTNYVDRRSNGFWCGIVVLFDDTYKETPPATRTGQILAEEFSRIVQKFKCE